MDVMLNTALVTVTAAILPCDGQVALSRKAICAKCYVENVVYTIIVQGASSTAIFQQPSPLLRKALGES